MIIFSNIKRGVLAIAIASVCFTNVASSQTKDTLPSEVTLFKNVNIWDGTSEQLKSGYQVLVVRNLIKKIAKDIPTTGSYELDVKSGGYREIAIAMPPVIFLPFLVLEEYSEFPVDRSLLSLAYTDEESSYMHLVQGDSGYL